MEESKLFHYTTANGLLGIIQSNSLWSTAYYCANDTSELRSAHNILKKICLKSYEEKNDCTRSNLDEDVDKFLDVFHNLIFSGGPAYISCFYRTSNPEEVKHGSLSQWRGYGSDGGYAFEIDSNKLTDNLKTLSEKKEFHYALDPVSYSGDFSSDYLEELNEIGRIFLKYDKFPISIINEMKSLDNGFFNAFMKLIVFNKNEHFSSESEVRLACVRPLKIEDDEINYFTRNGLIIPYLKSPESFDFLSCVDSIVVGPAPRMEDRVNSVWNIVKRLGLNIKVRASEIPLSRY